MSYRWAHSLAAVSLLGLLGAQLLLPAPLAAGERINHAGRILPDTPTVTAPVLFNTPAGDAIVSSLQIFPRDNAWNEDISTRPLLANSASMIAMIRSELATDRRNLRPFFEMNYVFVPENQPTVRIFLDSFADESDDLEPGSLNGDQGVGLYPIPANLPVELWPVNTPGLTLEQWQTGDDGSDRHAIMVKPGSGGLWETWRTRLTTGNPAWVAANGAKFNLTSNALRTDGWTSGDAAGLAMFPALVRYDECERGEIEHALRLIVKHTRNAYLYPATHRASVPLTSDPNIPAMGERLRLNSAFVVPANWTKQEKAVCAALKKYGAIVADNGNFFSISVAPDDRFPAGCFDNLKSIDVNQFEVVQTTLATEGPRSPGAPTADAGPDQTLPSGATATLTGTVGGTGTTVQWYAYPAASHPGTVNFSAAATASTTATFSADGTYVLMLKVSDGVHTPAYDAVRITVGQATDPGVGGGGTGGGGTGGGGDGGGSTPVTPTGVLGGQSAGDDFDGDGTINAEDPDDDNDGAADSADVAPFDFFSGGTTQALTVSKLAGSLKFNQQSKDSAAVSGLLPQLPALLQLNGRTAAVDIGGALLALPLGSKNSAKSDAGSIAFKLKPTRRNKQTKQVEFLGGDVAFKAKLVKGTFAALWSDEGASIDLTTKGTPAGYTVTVVLGGKTWLSTVPVTYSATAQKSGRFKN